MGGHPIAALARLPRAPGARHPVLVVVGARTGEADEPAELEPLRLDATEVLRPSPLSGAAVEELIAAELGRRAFGVSSRMPAAEATGGNPFLLTEVLRTLADEVDRPGCGGAQRSSARWAPSPSPARSARGLQPFGAEAASLARAIAVLGGAPQLRHACEAGRGQRGSRPGALRSASRRRDPGARASDRFRPSAGPHGGLWRALRGGPLRRPSPRRGADQLDRRATRARSRPTCWHARRTEISGSSSSCAMPPARRWLREPPTAARRYLERALEEPAREEVELTYELGRALGEASPIDAPELLVSVAERTDDPELRLQALQDAAWTYFDCGNLERAVHCLGRLVASIPADGEERALRAEASLFCLRTLNVGRRPDDSAHIEAVVANTASTTLGELHRPPGAFLRPLLAMRSGRRRRRAGRVLPPPALGRPGGGRARGQRFALIIGPVVTVACKILAWSGRWEVAREATARGWEGARSERARARRQLPGGRPGRDRSPGGQAGRFRGGGPHGVGHPPGPCAGLDPGADRDQQPPESR